MKESRLLLIFNKKEKDQTLISHHKLSGLYSEQNVLTFKANWLLNQAYFDEIKSWILPDHLNGILLKGAHLLSHYYPDLGNRFMGDVDILVDKNQLEDWVTYLEKIGYQDITGPTWKANEFKRVLLKKSQTLELVIELHTRLFYQENLIKWKTNPQELTSQLSFLSKEALFVHLCGHLAYQHTFLSLHWLYDIYLLIQKEQLEPHEVLSTAKKAHVLKSCKIISYLMYSRLKIKVDPILLPSKLIQILIDFIITDDFLIAPREHPIRYQLCKHFTKDFIHQALLYDLGWFRHKRKYG